MKNMTDQLEYGSVLIQDLDQNVVGGTIRIEGRRHMKVLALEQYPDNPLKRVKLHVLVEGGYDRVVYIRQDTVVLEVDIPS